MGIVEFGNLVIKSQRHHAYQHQLTKLRPYQEEYLRELSTNRYTFSTQSRQMGITTAIQIFHAWSLLFNTSLDKTFFIVTGGRQDSRYLRTVYSMVDYYAMCTRTSGGLIVNFTENNKNTLRLGNGNAIKLISGNPVSSDSFRGYNVNSIVVDNASSAKGLELLMGSDKPTCNIHINSCGGISDVLFKLQLEPGNFKNLEYHYTMLPELFSTDNIAIIKKNYGPDERWDLEMELVYESPKTNSRTLTFRIDDVIHSLMSKKLKENDISISDYLRNLILKDLVAE